MMVSKEKRRENREWGRREDNIENGEKLRKYREFGERKR